MNAFGDRLRRERERRGVTVHDISESTKISSRFLRALEAEDYPNLPGGVFNRGFLRAYCKYLGMDEEELVAEFDAAFTAYQAERLKLLPVVPVPEKKVPKLKLPRYALIAIASVVAIAAVSVGTWLLGSSQKQSNPEATASASESPSTPQPDAAKESSTADSQPETTPVKIAVAKTEGLYSRNNSDGSMANTAGPKADKKPAKAPISLEVRTREDSWISVTADGKMLMDGIMPAESSKRFRAQKNMVLKTGNAGGVELSYNGKALPPLGTSNEVKSLTFTPQGFLQ